MRLPPAWTKATAVFAKLTESEHGALPGRISNAHHYADNRAAGDALPCFQIGADTGGISSKTLGRDWSESFLVAKGVIYEDEISEVDERRHRSNCRIWRATLRKH